MMSNCQHKTFFFWKIWQELHLSIKRRKSVYAQYAKHNGKETQKEHEGPSLTLQHKPPYRNA